MPASEAVKPVSPPPAPEVAQRLHLVRTRMRRVALASAACVTILTLLLWLGIVMPWDWWVELPRWARAVALGVAIAAAAFGSWKYGLHRWWRPPCDRDIALAVERALPGFRSRFIAAVQLTSQQIEPQEGALVRALVAETAAYSASVDFRPVVSTLILKRLSLACLVALALGAAAWWRGRDASFPLLQRAFLIEQPVPRQTRITSFTGDCMIALGDDLRIEATTAGRIPAHGRLLVLAPGSKEPREFTLDADPHNAARFARTLQAVPQSFTYWLELGDNRTPLAKIEARPRPGVTQLAFEQTWPAYTGRPPRKLTPDALKILAGSKLTARIRPSAPLRDATLLLTGSDAAKPVQEATMLEQPSSGEWIGTVTMPRDGVQGLSFAMTDAAGLRSRGLAVYKIDILPDAPPTIQITWPERREELVTERATLLAAFEARDDFGVARVRLHFAVNWQPGMPHRSLDLDLGGAIDPVVARRFEWKLPRIQPPLKEGDVLDFWFEAIDANDITGPGTAQVPEHYQARIVSDAEKRAELTARLSDTLQGLNEVKAGQEDLARRLGELIQPRP